MLTIDVVSDVICPWCFVGKRRLEKALGDRPALVRWHPFELNPDMPPEGADRAAHYAEKFGGADRVKELEAGVAAAGLEEGIDFQAVRAPRVPNTFDAHRIIHLAGDRGAADQDAVVEALFRAYFLDGRDLTDTTVLAAIAAAAGLDRADVDDLLAGDADRDAVRAVEDQIRRAGVSSVPLYIINGRVALSGAQPPEYFQRAFDQIDPATDESTC